MLVGVLLLLCLTSWRVASDITLNGNSYENINIVIEDNVPENETLLAEIQDSFAKASALLFNATRNHVYFGKCKIIVPLTWTKKDSYTQTPALSLTGSRILIGNVKNPIPHVRGIKRCGQPGEYMHLTPDFFMHGGRTKYGKRENVIVHEWGHLRWGLGDEYTIRGPKFYRKNNEWRPNRCSEMVEGKVGYGINCEYDENCDQTASNMAGCFFCPIPIQKFEGASIMSYQFIDALKFFCDEADSGVPEQEIHNKDAPSIQNLICDRKSSWKVMREHSDFKNLLPLESTFDTSPTFEIVQESNGSRVLVLDVSGSMRGGYGQERAAPIILVPKEKNAIRGNRLKDMVSAATMVIDQLISLGSWLGIVKFSSSATISAALSQINSDHDRRFLISRLPNSASGGTCISCGIIKGIEVLRKNTGIAENGLVILISDGDTDQSDINVSIQSATEAKVVVHTIAISQSADRRLADIASSTSGTHTAYIEGGEISFASVFAGTISQGTTMNNENFETIASENFIASPSAVISFTIDTGLGRSTSVTVIATFIGNMSISLEGPDGYLHEYEGNTSIVVIKIPGIAKSGDYIVNVTFDAGFGKGQLYVVSFPTTGDGVVRLMTGLEGTSFDYESGSLPIIYTAIDKNSNPVLDVNVTATVEYDDNSCDVVLMDNGADPDVLADDGTYSAFIGIECLQSGRMSVQASAKAANGTARLVTGFPTAYSPDTEIKYETIRNAFQRVSASIELTVINYASDGKDIVVPGKVSDLAIRSVERSQLPYGEIRNVTIQWTPTGDDKSYGLASSYDIRMSTDIDELLDDVSFVSAESIALQNTTGNTLMEEYQFSLIVNESSPKSLYIALKAIDEVGNIGPVSNIVLFGPSDDVFLNITNEEYRTPEKESSDSVTVIIVTPLIIALLSICIVGSIVAYRIYRKRNTAQEYDVEPTLNNGFDDTMHQI